jgi:hypothetical protein
MGETKRPQGANISRIERFIKKKKIQKPLIFLRFLADAYSGELFIYRVLKWIGRSDRTVIVDHTGSDRGQIVDRLVLYHGLVQW